MAISCFEDHNIKEYEFKKTYLKMSILVDPRFEVKKDYLTEKLIYSIEGYIWSQELEKVIVKIDYPKDWWEAVKERWMPKLILKKFPVKYERIRKALVADVLYPDIREITDLAYHKIVVFER